MNINGKLVTCFEVINEIYDMIYEKETFGHLCMYHEIDCVALCHELMTYEFKDVTLFSNFHIFMSEDIEPVFLSK